MQWGFAGKPSRYPSSSRFAHSARPGPRAAHAQGWVPNICRRKFRDDGEGATRPCLDAVHQPYPQFMQTEIAAIDD
jgi:hypothetical protein